MTQCEYWPTCALNGSPLFASQTLWRRSATFPRSFPFIFAWPCLHICQLRVFYASIAIKCHGASGCIKWWRFLQQDVCGQWKVGFSLWRSCVLRHSIVNNIGQSTNDLAVKLTCPSSADSKKEIVLKWSSCLFGHEGQDGQVLLHLRFFSLQFIGCFLADGRQRIGQIDQRSEMQSGVRVDRIGRQEDVTGSRHGDILIENLKGNDCVVHTRRWRLKAILLGRWNNVQSTWADRWLSGQRVG